MSRAVALLLGLLAGAGCAGAGADDLIPVERKDLPVTVEAAGTLEAVDSVSIFPPRIPDVWEVKIAQLAAEGSTVRRGQPVVAFDDTELRRQLETKLAERDQAAKEAEKQELELEARLLDLDQRLAEAEARLRREQLKVEVPPALAARAELQKARLQLELAQGEVASLRVQRRSAEEAGRVQIEILRQRRDRAEGRVRELEQGIREMTVLAPRDGLVILPASFRGEKKKVGDSVSPFDRVVEIPDLARMRGAAEVDEADGGRIGVGQKVSLWLEAHPGVEFAGRVAEIGSAVGRQSWRSPLKVYRVRVELERTDPERMRPGMRFRAEIEVERVPQALVLPLEAVFPTPAGPVVYRRSGRALQETKVEIGARNQAAVEIRGGLAEGDRVARRPPGATAGGSR